LNQVKFIEEFYDIERLRKRQEQSRVEQPEKVQQPTGGVGIGINDLVGVIKGPNKGVTGVVLSIIKSTNSAKIESKNRAVSRFISKLSDLKLIEKAQLDPDEEPAPSTVPIYEATFDQEQDQRRNTDFTERQDPMYSVFIEFCEEIINSIGVGLNHYQVAGNALQFKKSRGIEFRNNKVIKIFLASFVFGILNASNPSPDVLVEDCEFDNWNTLAYFECALKRSSEFNYPDLKSSMMDTIQEFGLVRDFDSIKVFKSPQVPETLIEDKPKVVKQPKELKEPKEKRPRKTIKKKEGLESITLAELRDLARKRNIRGISTAKKADLIEILQNSQ